MEIKRTNIESKLELIRATRSSIKMSDLADGQELDKPYVEYTEVNSKGEDVRLLAVKVDEDTWAATNSKTFIDEFFTLTDLLEGEEYTIKKKSSVSKAGRTYITCVV